MLHRILVGQGWVSASEFWLLPPPQVWWIIEDRMPQDGKRHNDQDELLQALREAKKHDVARPQV